MEPHSNRTTAKTVATIAVLIITVAIVFGVKALSDNKPDTTASSTSTTQKTTSTAPASSTATYKDGSYTATGSYSSPGGTEKITVHVTLANSLVASTSAESGASDPTAHEFQDDFISGYKNLVVGKDLNSIHLSHVSGSSLTSQGFNRALEQIKSEAKS